MKKYSEKVMRIVNDACWLNISYAGLCEIWLTDDYGHRKGISLRSWLARAIRGNWGCSRYISNKAVECLMTIKHW